MGAVDWPFCSFSYRIDADAHLAALERPSEGKAGDGGRPEKSINRVMNGGLCMPARPTGELQVGARSPFAATAAPALRALPGAEADPLPGASQLGE